MFFVYSVLSIILILQFLKALMNGTNKLSQKHQDQLRLAGEFQGEKYCQNWNAAIWPVLASVSALITSRFICI